MSVELTTKNEQAEHEVKVEQANDYYTPLSRCWPKAALPTVRVQVSNANYKVQVPQDDLKVPPSFFLLLGSRPRLFLFR
jgi:hypothetical protein